MGAKNSIQKDQYNTELTNLIPEKIAYDKKVYESVGTYITVNLWKYMDKERIKNIVFVLDDPLHEYYNDASIIKEVLKSFLPKIKKSLHIDKQHLLKDQIKNNALDVGFLDRLIQQQLNLYHNNKNMSGMLTQILQQGQKKDHIDTREPYTRELINDKIPETQKSIIANILIFMILQEEALKEKK